MQSVWLKPFKEIYNFIFWWGITTPSKIFGFSKTLLLETDEALDLGTNIRLWLAIEPLFGDYTWQGRLSGFFLRGVRVIFSIAVYILVFLIGLIFMLMWLLLPVLAILLII